MNLKILIRTHAPDAAWLDWCLLSCTQRVPDLEIVVVCPEKDIDKVGLVTRKYSIPPQGVFPANKDGYIDQQWTKLNADHFCKDCDYIIHVDSDCVWTGDWKELFVNWNDPKPLMLKTPYADLAGDAVMCWQEITRKALGWKPDYEYMRRHPLVYPRWIYAKVRDHLRSVHEGVGGLERWVEGIRNREMSEFNLLGAWCDKFAPEAFEWLDTSTGRALPEPVMRQGWSWGGMTPEVVKEWKSLVPQ